jgi:hypothetical protein
MAQQPGGSGLFACQRIQAPTAVEHCLHVSFTAPHHHNLILAKTSELEVYLVDQVRWRFSLHSAHDYRDRSSLYSNIA